MRFQHRATPIVFVLLLLTQLTGGLYHGFSLPLQYDEWFSWRFFSSQGFRTVLCEYPAPNNHVFYNLVACFFLKAGFAPEIGVRLPAVIASVICAGLFYRLAGRFFSTPVSLLLMGALIATYNFAYWSFGARGYAFVFLGCVMLLQSVAMLSPGYKHIRGRALLIGALLLGFWTMPSFLYAALVPCGVLLFVLIRKKEWRSLVLYGIDLSGAGLLVVFAYSGILFLGDPHVLLHPEAWTDKFAFDENWLQDIFDYVRALYGGLLGIKSAVLLAISAIGIMIWISLKGSTHTRMICLISGLMFLLPFFIVPLHGVYPFQRTLSFLIVPALLLTGCALDQEFVMPKWNQRTITAIRTISLVVAVAIAAIGLSRVAGQHERQHGWEHRLEILRQGLLESAMGKFHTVARTNQSEEFFAAEMLIYMAAAENPGTQYDLSRLEKIDHQDLIVIHKKLLAKHYKDMRQYKLLLMYRDICVFAGEWVFAPADTH